ncbi:MAG: hypothetical protein DBX55_02035 [Verrucomicrobia bacterium]|nr:MAG: hypothetical protein DBX55_02035 [Verrucomicrobiota bacterium]
MKIAIRLIPFFVFYICAYSASAVDWIFDFEKEGAVDSSGNAYWSASLGQAATAESAAVDGYWYYLNEGGEKVYMQGAYSRTDDTFTFGSKTGMTQALTLNLDNDIYGGNEINLAKLTLLESARETGSSFYMVSVKANTADNISLTVDAFEHAYGTGAVSTNYYVEGLAKFIVNDSYSGTINYSTVNVGYFYVGGNLNSSMNEYGAFRGNGSLESPDMVVKGYISQSRMVFKDYNSSAGNDWFVSLGGLNNASTSSNTEVRMINHQSASNATMNFVFENASGTDYIYGGSLYETYNAVNRVSISVNPLLRASARLHFSMADDAVQTLSSDRKIVSGGIVVNSGTAVLGLQDVEKSAFDAQYSKDSSQTTTYTVTFFKSDKATQTSLSYGDLEMNGGVIAFTGEASSTKPQSAHFDNVIYAGGKIRLRMNSAASFDSLDLTSYYMKEVSQAGDEFWSDSALGGGTVKLADGAAAGTKVTFEFSGDVLGWLLDYEDGSFDINGGKGAKIVSWDAENKTALLASDFAGNIITQGDDYMPVFTVDDDGLYVRYTAVPEPAEVAAILGALALAAAGLRRRNRN